jgi:hypothetical protein
MFQKTSTSYGDKPDITFRFRKEGYAGTMPLTNFVFEMITKKRKVQISFCWRPNVTKWHWRNSKKKVEKQQ